jgi:hypothetical protein
MPPWLWPTMSTALAPVAAETPSTKVFSCAADCRIGAVPGNPLAAPYCSAKTQKPEALSAGAIVTQLRAGGANVP